VNWTFLRPGFEILAVFNAHIFFEIFENKKTGKILNFSVGKAWLW